MGLRWTGLLDRKVELDGTGQGRTVGLGGMRGLERTMGTLLDRKSREDGGKGWEGRTGQDGEPSRMLGVPLNRSGHLVTRSPATTNRFSRVIGH